MKSVSSSHRQNICYSCISNIASTQWKFLTKFILNWIMWRDPQVKLWHIDQQSNTIHPAAVAEIRGRLCLVFDGEMRVNRNLLLFFLSFSRSLQSFYEQGPGIDIIQQRTHLSSTHVQDGEASVADEFICRWTREKRRGRYQREHMASFCGLGKSKFRSRLKVEKEIKLGI